MADYNIKNLYEGASSSFYSKNANKDTDQLFTGYVIPAGELGTTTNPMVANQIEELNKTLNQGVIPVEIGTIDPKVFDVIPKQHFREMGRMAKLTGAKISVHAPVVGVEPSGLDPQGRQEWTEQSRRAVEEQLKSVVDRTLSIDKVGGNPITIHASNIPLAEWGKREGNMIKDEYGEQNWVDAPGKENIVKIRDMVINQETGQMSVAELRDMYHSGLINPDEKNIAKVTDTLKSWMTPEQSISSMNRTQWRKAVLEATLGVEKADEILRESFNKESSEAAIILAQRSMGSEETKKFAKNIRLNPKKEEEGLRVLAAREQIRDSKIKIDSLFDKAYRYGGEKERKSLAEAAKNYSEKMDKVKALDLPTQSQAIREIVHELSGKTPEQFISATNFATKKSAQTFANVALHSYDESKKGKKDPAVISIENMYQGLGFSRGEEMATLIEKSRENFIEEFTKKNTKTNKARGSKGQAEKIAKKIIGTTFDVGHLNMFKKAGFTDEELVKEAEKLKGYVKHIHLTDNFGYDDSHLPPGMGNVPINDLMQALEAGDLKARKIVEAGNFIQQFKSPAFSYNLESMGSPMFTGGGTSSYWGQSYFGPEGTSSASLQRGYFGGYGGMLPQLNYETFGAGFAQLPAELGGSRMGGAEGSRMSGKPME